MSTITGNTSQDIIQPLQPLNGLMGINLQSNLNPPKQDLMPEDEIDKLINSQIRQDTIKEVREIPPPVPPIIPPVEPPKSGPPTEEDSKEETSSFNLEGMNKNLDNIVSDTHGRIRALIIKQNTLNSRITLMERFIILDEKDLALELAKKEQNYTRISGLRKSLVNQTELLAQVMDILLKFEDAVHKWYKTLMDIEKDKVSAYQKVKAVTKETTTMDGDINQVLGQINNFIHTNPTIAQEAQGLLSISGYGGKPFNQ